MNQVAGANPVRVYDAIAATYDTLYSHPIHQAENEVIRCICNWRYGEAVLDVGCGTGLFLDLEPDAAPFYCGLDPSSRMVGQAKQKHRDAQFCVGTLSSTPPSWKGFDLAVSLFGPVSHMKNPPADLAHLGQLLRPGGRAVVMLMSESYSRGTSYFCQQSSMQPKATEYSVDDIPKLFSGTGLTVTRVRGFKVMGDDFYSQRFGVSGQVAALTNELETTGRLFPDLGMYLIVEASR